MYKRLTDTNSKQEKEEALSGIWEQIGFPEGDEHETLRAFEKLEQQIGGSSVKLEPDSPRFCIPGGLGLLHLSSSLYCFYSVLLIYIQKLLLSRMNSVM